MPIFIIQLHYVVSFKKISNTQSLCIVGRSSEYLPVTCEVCCLIPFG